ncbi:hypothetical protein JCM10449v2_006354 [Rhodotorula kratochvilovae]
MPVAILPDDVVLLVIETCDHLEKDRHKTLAALCRIAKRCKGAAERVLYSRVELEADSSAAQPVTPGTPLHTLVNVPRLRPNVQSVTLEISNEHAELPPVVDLLSDLKNVEELSVPHLAGWASTIFLAQENLRICSVCTQELSMHARRVLQTHSAAFSSVTRLVLGTILINAATAPPFCAGVTSFSIEYLDDPRAFVSFTSAFASHLTHLRLPIVHQLQGHGLATFPKLKHLSLVGKGFTAQALAGSNPHVASLLATAASLTTLVSLEFKSVLVDVAKSVRDNVALSSRGARATLGTPPSSVNAILSQALASPTKLSEVTPSQIQHLSLVTSFFRAEDVASYLLGASRPPALKTLRLGGAVGQGFNEFARTKSEWYADFEGTMEQAGVELTTVDQGEHAHSTVMPFAILPDELVHLIVDACDSLPDKREETLRSLCRLAKRYHAYAARALYARVKLHTSFKSGNVPEQGAALRAFLDVPGVHPYVRAIAFNINDRTAQEQMVEKALDLLRLPNLEEITIIAGCTRACTRVLEQGQTSIRRLVAAHWLGDTFQLIADYPQAFSALGTVELRFLSDTPTVTSIPDLRLSSFISNHPVIPSAFTPAFCANLISLTLPLFPELADYDLAQFSSLRRLALSHSLLPRSYNEIQHLFLDTCLLAAADVAAFLVGPDCPPRLRAAHISGAVGAELMDLLRQTTELAGTFERQGRQVRTWGSGRVEIWY